MSRGSADRVDLVTHATEREVIVLGVPTFGTVSIWWATRLYQLRMPINRIVRHLYVVGQEVGLARNEIVAKALVIDEEPGLRCAGVCFLDDDVLPHPEALIKLLSHQRPLVAGLYYLKLATPTPMVLSGEYEGVVQRWHPGDLVTCWAHGMGLTWIAAEVFRRLRDETVLGTDARGYPAWFQTTKDARVVRSDGVPAFRAETEDVHFLRRAAALGYQPVVDTSAQAFGWHWAQGEARAYPLAQWTEFTTTGRITWPSDEGFPVVWDLGEAA